LKILLDMNLSPSWVEVLAKAGIEAEHWSVVGDGRASDREIFEWASRSGFVIFTHDLDFGRLLALTGSAGPSVVLLRTLRILPAETAGTIVKVLRQHESDLERGAILVVDPEGSRVRLLPLRERS
jgi:predicted nuclease of predicted toxin-antitoxin system